VKHCHAVGYGLAQCDFFSQNLNEHVAVSMHHRDLVLCGRLVRGPNTKQRFKILYCCWTQFFQTSFAARTITEWTS